jgi:hypothetical protein
MVVLSGIRHVVLKPTQADEFEMPVLLLVVVVGFLPVLTVARGTSRRFAPP